MLPCHDKLWEVEKRWKKKVVKERGWGNVKNEKVWDDGRQCLCTNCWQDAVQNNRGKWESRTAHEMLFPTEDVPLPKNVSSGRATFWLHSQKQISCAVCRKPRTSLKAKQANKHLNTVQRKERELSVVQHASFNATDDPLCELKCWEKPEMENCTNVSPTASAKRQKGGAEDEWRKLG